MEAPHRLYTSDYVVSRVPIRFGGHQEDYLKRANLAIAQAVEKIRAAKKEGKNFEQLFFEILADFSRERSQIARDHGTKSSEEFGRRRDLQLGRFSFVDLNEPYRNYNEKMIDLFVTIIRKMETAPGVFEKSHTIEESCFGHTFNFQVEVLNATDMSERKWATRTYLPDYIPYDILKKTRQNEPFTTEELERLNAGFRQWKAKDPDEFRLAKIRDSLLTLNEKYPSPMQGGIEGNRKSLFVRGLVRAEINGKHYALGQYFTWMYEDGGWMYRKDPAHHPIEHMKEHSFVLIVHQDELLIEDTLKESAQIFKQILNWDSSKSLKTLQDQMTLLLFLLTLDVRDERGTAAENEWLECAIYEALDVECTKDPNKMLDLEIFSNPVFSSARQAYKEMVTLKLKNRSP